MSLRLTSLGLFLSLFTSITYAQPPSEFNGYAELRYRYEYQHHFNLKNYGQTPQSGESSDGFLLQRLRIGATWQARKDITLAVGLQDSRIFESDLDEDRFFYKSSLNHENNSYQDEWELYQTYVEIKNLIFQNLTLTAGRQTIAYGDKRIFGPGNWGNTGRYQWDAVKLSHRWGKNFMDLLWGAHIIHEPEQQGFNHRHNHHGGGLYAHLHINDTWFVEPFYLIKYDQHDNFSSELTTENQGDLFTRFAGMRIVNDNGRFFYDGTAVFQRGHYGSDQIRAWGAHALLGTRLAQTAYTPIISLEYSFASGDSDPFDGKRETFNGVFGARDSMYGRMNLLDWSNLHDFQGNISFSAQKKLKVQLEGHRFYLAEKKDGWSLNSKLYRDKTGHSGRHLGDELDIIASWVLPQTPLMPAKITLMAGYSHFWPGTFVKNVADDVQADWFFAQINYSYRF